MKPQLEPVLVTSRLVLRPLREADLDDLVAAIDDAEVTRMLAVVPLPYTRVDGERFLVDSRRRASEGRSLNLSIVHDGRLVGGIAIGGLPRRCEFGYWLGRAAWGKGLATEAGRAILAYGFEVLGLRLVRSGVFVENRASLRVQKKLGFAATGRSVRQSLARGYSVPHIDTVLTRDRFAALVR